MRKVDAIKAVDDLTDTESGGRLTAPGNPDPVEIDDAFREALSLVCERLSAAQIDYAAASRRRYPNMTAEQALKLCIAEDLRDLTSFGKRTTTSKPGYVLHEPTASWEAY